MSQATVRQTPRVVEVVRKYGRCLELVAIDPHFHDITVGLYAKDAVATVWTFSTRSGVERRIREIRDLLVARGGMVPVAETHDRARFDCGHLHGRPVGFLVRNCVEKSPDLEQPGGAITVRDFRTRLTLTATPAESDGRWIYEVTAEGEAKKPEFRIRAIVNGFVRYGEMTRVSASAVAFACGARHDHLVRLLIPLARNVSSVEDSLDADSLRGQMTTSTLGFAASP